MNLLIHIRPAKQCLADIKQIARVHVESWREVYKGILPNSFITQYNLEKRIELWKKILLTEEKPQSKHQNRMVLVAENQQGKIVGFTAGGAPLVHRHLYDGEIYAFYILKKYHRQGIGTNLFHRIFKWFQTNKTNNLVIWILRDNQAGDFFIKMGAIPQAIRHEVIDNLPYPHIAYVWSNRTKPP